MSDTALPDTTPAEVDQDGMVAGHAGVSDQNVVINSSAGTGEVDQDEMVVGHADVNDQNVLINSNAGTGEVDQDEMVVGHADVSDQNVVINSDQGAGEVDQDGMVAGHAGVSDQNVLIDSDHGADATPEPEPAPELDDVEESVSRLDALRLDDPDSLRKAVEAVLFVVDAPVSAEALAAALQRPVTDVEAAIEALRHDLDARGSGVEVREIAGGVRLYTRTEWSPAVEAFLLEGQRNKLSQASLETLAVIAYRQPVSRARISAIRGVTVDGVVRTLLARGLLVEAGTDPDTGATLLATTDLFLERMGLQSLAELPSLAPLLPDAASLSALDDADGLDVDDL